MAWIQRSPPPPDFLSCMFHVYVCKYVFVFVCGVYVADYVWSARKRSYTKARNIFYVVRLARSKKHERNMTVTKKPYINIYFTWGWSEKVYSDIDPYMKFFCVYSIFKSIYKLRHSTQVQIRSRSRTEANVLPHTEEHGTGHPLLISWRVLLRESFAIKCPKWRK